MDYNLRSSKYTKVIAIDKGIIKCTVLAECGINDFLVDAEARKIAFISCIEETTMQAVICTDVRDVYVEQKLFVFGTTLRFNNPLGCVVNALGETVVERDRTSIEQNFSFERDIFAFPKGVMQRRKVQDQLLFGIATIDILFPIARGQRMLFAGGSNTGKTSAAVNCVFANANDKNLIVIYCSIALHNRKIMNLYNSVRAKVDPEKFVFVCSNAGDPIGMQFLAPFTAAGIAEEFCQRGKDVVVIFDSLSNHSAIYREISLLGKNFPGRESYPGDIFFLNANLLERGGAFLGAGSITMLPILNVIGNDLTQYIPTSIVSITDGQIVTDRKIWNTGIKPAIDLGRSVSRTGASAQGVKIRAGARGCSNDMTKFADVKAFVELMGASNLTPYNEKIYEIGRRWNFLFMQDLFHCYDLNELTVLGVVARNNKIKFADMTFEVKRLAEKIKTMDVHETLVFLNQLSKEIENEG